MDFEPSPNGRDGRDASGRFAAGNNLGRGNPHGSVVNRLRGVLFESVTDDDLKAVVSKLLTMAKSGDLAAIRELLDRVLGKPTAAVELELSGGCDSLSTDAARVSLAAIRERLLAKADADSVLAEPKSKRKPRRPR